jgi:hypothetical protein
MEKLTAHGIQSQLGVTEQTGELLLLINQYDLFKSLPSAPPSCLSALAGLRANSLLRHEMSNLSIEEEMPIPSSASRRL